MLLKRNDNARWGVRSASFASTCPSPRANKLVSKLFTTAVPAITTIQGNGRWCPASAGGGAAAL